MPHDPLQAIEKIEKTLLIERRPMSLSRLSKKSGLHYITVKRYVNLLESVKKMPSVETIKGDGTTLVRIEHERDLLLLPEEEQNKIIKSYFPKMSSEEKLLVKLIDKHILSQKLAIRLRKNKMIKKLLSQGQLKETKDKRIYLTEFGQKIARGAKSIYG